MKNGERKEWRLAHQMYKNRHSYLMILPFFVFFLIFNILPVGMNLVLGFTDFNMVSPPKYIGLSNFEKLFFEDELFIKAIVNTLQLVVITGPISFIASLLFAWFINELPRRVRAVMVFIFYLPQMITGAYGIWVYMFSPDARGFVNSMLMKWHVIVNPIGWLISPDYIMKVVIIVTLWLSLGSGFLSNISGLQTIDDSLYEAGAIDGIRNRWQELRYITLPSLVPFILFGVVMQISSSFTAGVVATSLAGYPQTDYAAHTIMTHISEYGGIRFEMGYAAAIGFILTIIMIVVKETLFAVIRKFEA